MSASSASVAGDDAGVAPAGHFRIYLGAAAGVGKTFAMLSEGARRRDRGTDVVIGFVETHGRARTIEMTAGFEVVPRRRVEYRGAVFEEMDLAAVLARRPAVALVDELAHTNVPGSGPHAKRWEDVMDLLAAGIDVITTVNIQHLESLADTVESMTGTPVRERVPDWVVRRADQIELVDASPEALRRRMLHGNIYPPEKVPEALSHFFRTDHLAALRELALRFLADEVDEALLNRLAGEQTDRVWETAERILVAVSAAPGTEGLVRRAARLAARVKAQLTVLHVATGEGSGEDRQRLEALRILAADVGAHWVEVHHDDPARALTEYARAHQMTQLVVGASLRSRWSRLAGRSFIARVLSAAGQAGIDVHVIARRGTS
jgi:two-component system sensor histidine kinase KdpD